MLSSAPPVDEEVSPVESSAVTVVADTSIGGSGGDSSASETSSGYGRGGGGYPSPSSVAQEGRARGDGAPGKFLMDWFRDWWH